MKKLISLIAVSLVCMSVQAQTFAGVKIGETRCEVKESIGKPKGVETSHWHGLKTWRYKTCDGPTLYVAFTGEKVSHIVAWGKKDEDGLYHTRHGVKLGDKLKRVECLYGNKFVEFDTDDTYTLKYSNIAFTFRDETLIMIDVFAPVKRHLPKSLLEDRD